MRFVSNFISLFLLLLLFACGSHDSLPAPNPPPDSHPETVKIDWNTFADHFQNTLQSIYKNKSGTYITRPDKRDFNYWFNAHVLDVLVDGYNRTNDKQYLSLMKELLRGIKIKNWGTYWKVYVDDMCWLGIACMNAWHASHDEEYKNTAIYILNEIKKAHTDVLGGGLQWRFDGPNAKHACSTGPGGILALRLYEAEKKEEDLIFAKELYQWETATLLNPSNYLVWDNIFKNEAGVIEIKKDWMYTYNVGTYVGMAKDLYLQTGDKKYLEAAVRSALASISSSDMVANNMFKETGDHDGGLFKGILVRYLTEMVFTEGVTETFKKSVVRFLKSNANVLYNKGTSPPPAVFASSDWSIRPEKSHDLSTQLSAMMLVESMAKFDKSGLLTP